jgi:hypothetical protein
MGKPSETRDHMLERCKAVRPKSLTAFFPVREAAGSIASLRPLSRPLKVGGGL